MEQDPVMVAPHVYKVLLENERVRVLKASLKRGAKSPMHWHPGSVIYSLTDGTVKVAFPNGISKTLDVKAGVARWDEPVSHAGENLGDTDIDSIIVELKGSKK